MNVIGKLNDQDGNLAAYMFYCPGCGEYHSFAIGRWTFNNDFEKPTFAPSLLVTKPSQSEYRCHLFVRDGRIEYCSDSNHQFAGKTIAMEDIDD